MRANRVWLETILLGVGIGCACALVIASLAGAGAVVAHADIAPAAQAAEPSSPAESAAPLAPSAERTFEGMVTCSRCGAKHSAAMGKSATDCARECVHAGAAFALVEGEDIYSLKGDLAALKKVAGERARVVGAVQGKTILVSSVTPAN